MATNIVKVEGETNNDFSPSSCSLPVSEDGFRSHPESSLARVAADLHNPAAEPHEMKVPVAKEDIDSDNETKPCLKSAHASSSDSDRKEEYRELKKKAKWKTDTRKPKELSIDDRLRKMKIDPDKLVNETRLTLGSPGFGEPHKCAMKGRPWDKYLRSFGECIRHLEVYDWCWKSAKHNCSHNLLKALTRCPNILSLRIFGGCPRKHLRSNGVLHKGSLPKLEKISIQHEGKIHYQAQLIMILSAATDMNEFSYIFTDHEEANGVLDILVKNGSSGLRQLKITSKPSGFMKREHIERLLQLDCPSLKALSIGYGLWNDVTGDLLRQLFKKFSLLSEFVVPGSYCGNTLPIPKISMELPPQPALRLLEAGDDHGSSKDSCVNGGGGGHLPVVQYNVTIKIGQKMPALRALTLGRAYHLEELNLTNFPKLQSLKIAGPWHLLIAACSSVYPRVTTLQLPDSLKDSESFIQKLPNLFPNLKQVWINFPTVKTLRTFFNAMRVVNLEELYLRTQFDFSIAMELALLDGPLPLDESSEDYSKLKRLQDYDKLQEFVRAYNVQLPPKTQAEIDAILADPNGAGISALQGLKLLRLEHVPRQLRIPTKGQPWDEPDLKFSAGSIGYKCYPLSKGACQMIQYKTEYFRWHCIGGAVQNLNWWGQHGFKRYFVASGSSSDSDTESSSDEKMVPKTKRRRKRSRKSAKTLKPKIKSE